MSTSMSPGGTWIRRAGPSVRASLAAPSSGGGQASSSSSSSAIARYWSLADRRFVVPWLGCEGCDAKASCEHGCDSAACDGSATDSCDAGASFQDRRGAGSGWDCDASS